LIPPQFEEKSSKGRANQSAQTTKDLKVADISLTIFFVTTDDGEYAGRAESISYASEDLEKK